jgi:hypothetical protein
MILVNHTRAWFIRYIVAVNQKLKNNDSPQRRGGAEHQK